jgi:hypothetical protein
MESDSLSSSRGAGPTIPDQREDTWGQSFGYDEMSRQADKQISRGIIMAKSKFTPKASKTKKSKGRKTGRGHGNAWKAYVSPTSNTPIPW